MAKNRHTISDIQKALTSHTHYIKEPETPASISQQDSLSEQPENLKEAPKSENDIAIDPKILRQFRILAQYQNEPVEELVNNALNHYLRLKALQLERAILKLTEEQ